MSFESSAGPEVYQYAPQTYSSHNISPFFVKPSPNPVITQPLPQFSSFAPQYTRPQIDTSLNFTSNTYHPSASSHFPLAEPFQYKASHHPLQVTNSKPEIIVDNYVLQGKTGEISPSTQLSSDRYDSYLDHKSDQYMYNIFSFADEPWNRCINGDGCGKFPANECIARPNKRKYWN